MYKVLKIEGEPNDKFIDMWNRFLVVNEGHDPVLLNLSLSIYQETNPEIIK